MATSFKNFNKGVSLVPNSTDLNTTKGDKNVLSSDGKEYHHNGTTSSAVVTEKHASQGAARLTNKDLEDSTTAIVDASDTTIKVKIDAAGTTGTSTTITSSQTADRTLTLPDVTDTIVARTTTDTLTNKTLTAPVIATIVNSGTLTLPTSTDTLVGRATSDTLTNKVLSGNTATNLISGSGTLTLNTSGTITVPNATDTLVGKATSDTLTNKTLTSPILNTPTADTITGIAAGPLTLTSPTGQNLVLQNATTTTATVTSTGMTLATGKLLVLTNNSQTVSLKGNASASASYTIDFPAAAPTASTALVYNGSTFTWATAGGYTLSSSTSLTGSGTISISTTAGQQIFRVASSSGDITLSTTPFGSSAPVDGAVIRLLGTSDANSVSITHTDSAKGCMLKGACTLRKGDIIEFQYTATDDRFFEVSRNF